MEKRPLLSVAILSVKKLSTDSILGNDSKHRPGNWKIFGDEPPHYSHSFMHAD